MLTFFLKYICDPILHSKFKAFTLLFNVILAIIESTHLKAITFCLLRYFGILKIHGLTTPNGSSCYILIHKSAVAPPRDKQ